MRFPSQYVIVYEPNADAKPHLNHVAGRLYIHDKEKVVDIEAPGYESIVGRALVWCSPSGRVNIGAPESYHIRRSQMGRIIDSIGENLDLPKDWQERSSAVVAENL